MRKRFVVLVACLLATLDAANAAEPVLASVDFSDADTPAQVTNGDLSVRLSAGPTHDGGGADSIAKLTSPRGNLEMVITGEESPFATVRIVRLAPGDEPQVLFQRAAVGSAACVVSKLAFIEGGTWRAIDLDRVCEAEDGYQVIDIDGDGLGELVSQVGYFDVFEAHPHQSHGPIRIQRLLGGRVVVATGARRYRDYLRKSLPGSPDVPPESNGGDYTTPAAWMATKALLGETREAWAAMVRAFARDRQIFEVCSVREVRDECPSGRTAKRPFLQALALVLVADNYAKSPEEVSLP